MAVLYSSSRNTVIAGLVPVLVYFKQARQPGESLGDFCHRKGVDDLRSFAAEFQAR